MPGESLRVFENSTELTFCTYFHYMRSVLTALTVSRRVTCLLALAGVGTVSVRGLDFNFIAPVDFPPPLLTAAVAAGNLWSGYFSDPVTINIQLAYGTPAGGGIANTTAPRALFAYSTVTTALSNDRLTDDDFSAVANLQPGSSARFLINRTGVAEPSLRMDTGTAGNSNDQNNTSVLVYHATAKALGLRDANHVDVDGTLTLSKSIYEANGYDYDRSNGITVGQYDAIGTIAHEIGHVLGMFSTAELISTSGAFVTEESAGLQPTVADLLRFSAESINPLGTFGGAGANIGVFDISADTRPKYFSVDGGTTPLTEFAQGSGAGFGDGQQANHWKDFVLPTPAGLMDPTIRAGELLNFSTVDFRFFDAIGFDPVPEAGTWAAGVGASLALWARRRMNRRA